MGRPLRRAETVDGNFHTGAIGASSGTGQQITMQAYVDGGSANVTTEIVQKGTKRFRCTTSDGTQTCTLVSKASGSLAAGECSLVATDSAGNTAYVTKLTSNYASLYNIDSTQFGMSSAGDEARALWLDDQDTAVEDVSVLIVTA